MKSKFAPYVTLYKGRPVSAFESDCIDAAHGMSPSTCPRDLDPTLIFDLNLLKRIYEASDERGHSRAVEKFWPLECRGDWITKSALPQGPVAVDLSYAFLSV
ncbi:unnamed protein product [Jaminaea pallidilutea]